jgi:hypothetical protein
MNLTELSQSLDSQADIVDDIGVPARLGSVHHRVRVARRRRAAAGVAVTAAAVVAASTALALSDGGRPRGDAPITEPSPTVISGDSHGFASSVGSMELLGGVVGRPGQVELTLETDVPTDRVRVAVWCFGGQSRRATTETLVADVENSSAEEADGCSAQRPEVFTPHDAANGMWTGGSGLPPYVTLNTGAGGGALSVTSHLRRAPKSARLAIAVYGVPQPEATVAGLDVYPLWFDGDRTRELVAYGDNPSGFRSVQVEIPASARPVEGYYLFSLEGPSPGGRLELLVDGELAETALDARRDSDFPSQPAFQGTGSGGQLQIELTTGSPHVVELRATGADPDQLTLGLVFYTDLGEGLG